jgi:hypothetical protein
MPMFCTTPAPPVGLIRSLDARAGALRPSSTFFAESPLPTFRVAREVHAREDDDVSVVDLVDDGIRKASEKHSPSRTFDNLVQQRVPR